MKLAELVITGAGALGSLGLFFVRRSQWFLTQQRRAMSEPAEIVEALFWAFILLFAAGVLLLLRRLLSRKKSAAPAAEPSMWTCACCGSENPEDQGLCLGCGRPYGAQPQPRQAYDSSDWVCPWCGRVHPDSAAICTQCGYDRFGTNF